MKNNNYYINKVKHDLEFIVIQKYRYRRIRCR